MSTPPPEGPEAGANLPVNIAPPNWQCPHCLTKYYTNLEAATACAAAGPAPEATEGTPVLVLSAAVDARRSAAVFGTTQVGPVRTVKTETGARAHTRDVVVAGKQVSAADLAAAAEAADGLRILADTRPERVSDSCASPTLYRWGVLADLFTVHDRHNPYRDPAVTVWLDEPHQPSDQWWSAPDEQQRAALNVVTGGLLERIVDSDVDELAAQIRATYAPTRRSYRPSMAPADVAGPAGGLTVAAAHGAPNHIWALRWLTTHLPAVTAWQAATLRAWAAGTGGPVPATSLQVPDTLPRSPGKRRLAVMEPYGDDYHLVRDAVLAELTTDAPVNPVPAIADVDTTMRPTQQKEAADDV